MKSCRAVRSVARFTGRQYTRPGQLPSPLTSIPEAVRIPSGESFSRRSGNDLETRARRARGVSTMFIQSKAMFPTVLALALLLTALMPKSPGAVADEPQARHLLKAMTDYLGAQDAMSFDYDATLEVVTTDRQKLELAASGMVSLV